VLYFLYPDIFLLISTDRSCYSKPVRSTPQSFELQKNERIKSHENY